VRSHPDIINPGELMDKLRRPEARRVFASIYNNVLLATDVTPIKSILVCAADVGEGATTVAVGLALAAAEQQTGPVLLIDGNFRQPGVLAAFGQKDLYGLGEIMAGKIEAGCAINATETPNLGIMGAGAVQPNYVVKLESPNFQRFLQKLSTSYAPVIVDGPAVNLCPESVLFASQVDRVFLVVHAGETRVQVVEAALSKLAANGCDKVEVVLNRRTFPIPQWIYKKL
jgi:capsular exopolysaccharide synthesis family protein